MHDYPTEKLRATALDQFANLYPSPIASQRRYQVEPELLARAETSGRSAREEVFEAVKTAASFVRPTSSPERSFEANIRQQLNELVTENILDSKLHKLYDRKSRRRMQPTEVEALATLAEGRSSGPHDHEDELLEKIAREEFLDELQAELESARGRARSRRGAGGRGLDEAGRRRSDEAGRRSPVHPFHEEPG